jgi:hypothetical protein
MATGRVPTTANSPLTTKGDLFTYDTSQARLAVGSNGETLVADSSQTAGLRYNPPAQSLSNGAINGGMDIWQRGTSFSFAASTAASGSTYTTDRWQTKTNANQAVTVSRQVTNDTTNLPNIQYCLRYQRNSGQTGTGDLDLISNMETVNSIPYAGKTVTISFYARKGADYSAASSALACRIFTGTGTDQNIFTGYTGTTTISAGTATLTTSWQRFAFTVSIGATATQMALDFLFVPVGTASTNDYYEVTGVQLDIGTWTSTTAPTFRRSAGTLAGELAACQRYYWRQTGESAYSVYGMGANTSTTNCNVFIQFPQIMRTSPSAVEFTTLALQESNSGAVTAVTALTVDSSTQSTKGICLNATVASGLTQHRTSRIEANNSTSAYIGFSAEL